MTRGDVGLRFALDPDRAVNKRERSHSPRLPATMRSMKPLWCTLVVMTSCSAPVVKPAQEPNVDVSIAARGARTLMKEIYANLRQGATGGLLPLLEPNVIAMGPGPTDVYTDRSTALVALSQVITVGEKHKLRSTDLRVAASPAGHAAWGTDVIDLDGQRYVIGMILLEEDQLWTVAAVQIGRPLTARRRESLFTKGPPPDPTLPPAPEGGNDKSLAVAWKAGAVSVSALSDQLAQHSRAVARDLGGKARVGHKPIRKEWQRNSAAATAPRPDPVHARLAPDGTMGWVFGIIDVTEQAKPPLPTRALYVYERAANDWRLVLALPTVAEPRPL